MLQARDAEPRRGPACASAARTRRSSGSSSPGTGSAGTRRAPTPSPTPTPIRRPTSSPIGTTPATDHVRRRGKLNANAPVPRADLRRPLRGPRPRRSPTPIRATSGRRTSTTSPGSRRGRTSSSPPLPATGTFASASRSAAGRTVTITLRFADELGVRQRRSRRYGRHQRRDAVAQAAQLRNLIDDTEKTLVGHRSAPIAGGNLSVDGKKVTVDLAGTAGAEDPPRPGQRPDRPGPRTASPRCASSRSGRATRPTATTARATPASRWRTRARRRLPGRPAAAGRPADDPAGVRHPEHAGDAPAPRRQDEPVHGRPAVPGRAGRRSGEPNADCDSNVPAGSSRSFVRAAELQAFCSSSQGRLATATPRLQRRRGPHRPPPLTSTATTVAACRAPSSSIRWPRASRRR